MFVSHCQSNLDLNVKPFKNKLVCVLGWGVLPFPLLSNRVSGTLHCKSNVNAEHKNAYKWPILSCPYTVINKHYHHVFRCFQKVSRIQTINLTAVPCYTDLNQCPKWLPLIFKVLQEHAETYLVYKLAV